MKEFSRDGFVFDVDDTGPEEGTAVVLLHGFPENKSSWSAVARMLVDAGYRVLAPDQRGYSPRARPRRRRDYRLGELTADVIALIDAAGADRVHVVGHDWGGAVAWALAMHHADRLRSLSVLSTPHPQAFIRALVTSRQFFKSWYMFAFQLPWLPERVGTRRLARELVRGGLDAELASTYAAELSAPGALRAAINWYRAMPLTSPHLVRGSVTTPTLYVYSTGDTALGRKAADLTAEFVTGPYRYEVLEGVSHWIPEAASAEVVRLLANHFAKYPG